MNSNQIRQNFLSFYAAKGHEVVPTVSFVVKSPTLARSTKTNLWTWPFYPISLGQRQTPSSPSTALEKYISPNIQVLTQRHPTFFEMLGHCGNYSKQQALTWAWELCTEVYQLPPSQLVVSVPDGDTETLAIWRDCIGIPDHQIIETRWNSWRPHEQGHCGQSTRIHYDCYPERGYESAASEEDIIFCSKDREFYDRNETPPYILPEEDLRFLSFYTLVLMESDYQPVINKRHPLPTPYIDAAIDVERLTTILQKVSSFYETDLIFPILQTATQVAGIDYVCADSLTKISLQAIADQIRAAVHLSADYSFQPHQYWPQIIHNQILNWLMRLVLHTQLLGIEHSLIEPLIAKTIEIGEAFYPHLRQQEQQIVTYLKQQESQCWKMLQTDRETGIVTGYLLDRLFRVYNCSQKTIIQWAERYSLTIDWKGYNAILGPEID